MRLALTVIVIWWLGSVPLALLVGRFLRLRSNQDFPDTLAREIEARYWSVADLGGDLEELSLWTLQTGHIGAVQPAQRELSSV
jgi:hypothetical protein